MLDRFVISASGPKGRGTDLVEVEMPNIKDEIGLNIRCDSCDLVSIYISAEEALEIAQALIKAAWMTL